MANVFSLGGGSGGGEAIDTCKVQVNGGSLSEFTAVSVYKDGVLETQSIGSSGYAENVACGSIVVLSSSYNTHRFANTTVSNGTLLYTNYYGACVRVSDVKDATTIITLVINSSGGSGN